MLRSNIPAGSYFIRAVGWIQCCLARGLHRHSAQFLDMGVLQVFVNVALTPSVFVQLCHDSAIYLRVLRYICVYVCMFVCLCVCVLVSRDLRLPVTSPWLACQCECVCISTYVSNNPLQSYYDSTSMYMRAWFAYHFICAFACRFNRRVLQQEHAVDTIFCPLMYSPVYDYTQIVDTADHNEGVSVLFFGMRASYCNWIRVLNVLNQCIITHTVLTLS